MVAFKSVQVKKSSHLFLSYLRQTTNHSDLLYQLCWKLLICSCHLVHSLHEVLNQSDISSIFFAYRMDVHTYCRYSICVQHNCNPITRQECQLGDPQNPELCSVTCSMNIFSHPVPTLWKSCFFYYLCMANTAWLKWGEDCVMADKLWLRFG